MPRSSLTVKPLTPDRWQDLERLFGPRGACAGCWCMWWRLRKPEFDAQRGEGNRTALQAYARERVPGLLAYDRGEPVGWVAVEPRAAYPRIARSRTLRTGASFRGGSGRPLPVGPSSGRRDPSPPGDEGIWSITCFYVARSHRGTGLMARLVDAAVKHARAEGARAVEAYPVDYDKPVGATFVYTGAASVFRRAGFQEVLRKSRTRPVMRKVTGRRAPTGRDRAGARSSPRRSPRRASASPRGR